MFRKRHSYQEVADNYDTLAASYATRYSSPIYQASDQRVVDLLCPFLTPQMRVLDVGCGTGDLIKFFPSLSPAHYLGIDISRNMLVQAKQHYPAYQFIQSDMHEMHLSKQHFDVIVSLHGTFSYSKAPEQLLRIFFDLLRPAGILIFMPYTLPVKYDQFFEQTPTSTVHASRRLFRQYLSSDKLMHLLRKSGFRACKATGINFVTYQTAYYDSLSQRQRRVSEYYAEMKALDAVANRLHIPPEYFRHRMFFAKKPSPRKRSVRRTG